MKLYDAQGKFARYLEMGPGFNQIAELTACNRVGLYARRQLNSAGTAATHTYVGFVVRTLETRR